MEELNSSVENKHTRYYLEGTVTPTHAEGAVPSAPPSPVPTTIAYGLNMLYFSRKNRNTRCVCHLLVVWSTAKAKPREMNQNLLLLRLARKKKSRLKICSSLNEHSAGDIDSGRNLSHSTLKLSLHFPDTALSHTDFKWTIMVRLLNPRGCKRFIYVYI